MSFEKVVVPSSTAEYQIFPLGTCSNDYNTGDYNPEFANAIASPQEIAQVINDIQVARQPAVRKKWLANLLLVLACFVLVIIGVAIRIILLGYSSYIGLIVMVIIISICTVPIDAVYKKRSAEITKESKDACYKMLDDKYKVAFESKGLRWFLPIHFPYWVELQKINTYGGNQTTAQPIYIPPAMR